MKYIKQEIISKLKECHDEIKKHPFRTSFLAKHIQKAFFAEKSAIVCVQADHSTLYAL